MNQTEFRTNREMLIAPANFSNTAATSGCVRITDCPVVTVVVSLGSLHDSADSDLTVLAKADFTASGGTALASLKYRIKLDAGQWGAWATVTDSKIDIVTGGEVNPATADKGLIEIEIPTVDFSAALATAKAFYIDFTACGQTTFTLGAVACLENGRYQAAIPNSAIA